MDSIRCGGSKRAVADSKHNGDALISLVGDGKVEDSITIDIGDSNGAGPVPDRVEYRR